VFPDNKIFTKSSVVDFLCVNNGDNLPPIEDGTTNFNASSEHPPEHERFVAVVDGQTVVSTK
jgi:hypothetical protein